jgi:hypothetical protein
VKTYEQVQVGDDVLVFDYNGHRIGQPDDGWEGKVVKAGPKLITIDYGKYTTEVFRRESGRANDRYGHQYYKTPEEYAETRRRSDALAALREFGLEPVRFSGVKNIATDRLIQIVALLEEPE